MSRQYLNDHWCVRCGRSNASPYLRKNINHFKKQGYEDLSVVDIGCGNGRNTNFMIQNGFKNCRAFDMAKPFGEEMILGVDDFPIEDKSVNIILANYVLMFLDEDERNKIIDEIKRIASDDCMIMVELYSAKDSYADTKEKILAMQKEIFNKLGWTKILYSQQRFLAIKK